jgi:hypothetical protein
MMGFIFSFTCDVALLKRRLDKALGDTSPIFNYTIMDFHIFKHNNKAAFLSSLSSTLSFL